MTASNQTYRRLLSQPSTGTRPQPTKDDAPQVASDTSTESADDQPHRVAAGTGAKAADDQSTQVTTGPGPHPAHHDAGDVLTRPNAERGDSDSAQPLGCRDPGADLDPAHIASSGERNADRDAIDVALSPLLGAPDRGVDPVHLPQACVAEVEPDPSPLSRVTDAQPGPIGANIERAVSPIAPLRERHTRRTEEEQQEREKDRTQRYADEAPGGRTRIDTGAGGDDWTALRRWRYGARRRTTNGIQHDMIPDELRGAYGRGDRYGFSRRISRSDDLHLALSSENPETERRVALFKHHDE